MVTASLMNEINSLQPEEQTIVASLVRSFVIRNDRRTEAQKRFEEECRLYEGREMTMEEIDSIIHEASEA